MLHAVQIYFDQMQPMSSMVRHGNKLADAVRDGVPSATTPDGTPKSPPPPLSKPPSRTSLPGQEPSPNHVSRSLSERHNRSTESSQPPSRRITRSTVSTPHSLGPSELRVPSIAEHEGETGGGLLKSFRRLFTSS